jgi:hypothetical protein
MFSTHILGANGLKAMLLCWCMWWVHMRWCQIFYVAWARRSFSFGKCQVNFSLPANVHPDESYLVSIHSWLNKVDPTRSPCVLHVTSRVVLRREGKCFFGSDWSYQGQISMIIQDFLCSSTPRFAVYLMLCANNNLCGAPPAIPDAHPEVPY